MGITTIKLSKNTKERIGKLKVHKRESYDDILQKILGILNTCKVNPERAKSKLEQIDRARKYTKLSDKSFG